MIFVDANVFLYLIGNDEQYGGQARAFLASAQEFGEVLCTSAGVLEEVCHTLWRQGEGDLVHPVLSLVSALGMEVWPLEEEDVRDAVLLHDRFPALDTMDLCHLASCLRRNASSLKTFDRRLEQAAAAALS